MKNWYHKLHSDEINKSSHQKSPKIAKIATWRNFEKVDFGKNGAKSSLMMFHTTFVRKKSEMFMQMSISMSTPFLPHCVMGDFVSWSEILVVVGHSAAKRGLTWKSTFA